MLLVGSIRIRLFIAPCDVKHKEKKKKGLLRGVEVSQESREKRVKVEKHHGKLRSLSFLNLLEPCRTFSNLL